MIAAGSLCQAGGVAIPPLQTLNRDGSVFPVHLQSWYYNGILAPIGGPEVAPPDNIPVNLRFVLGSTTYIEGGGTSPYLPAVNTGTFPPGSIITLEIVSGGLVVGLGGSGGDGSSSTYVGKPGQNGFDGKEAIRVLYPLNIENGGIIAGGGGGGGGGGGVHSSIFYPIVGGGGGGGGSPSGPLGLGGTGNAVTGTPNGSNGQSMAATVILTGGTGGVGGNVTAGAETLIGGTGGHGGAIGQAGSAGAAGTGANPGLGGAGGAAGPAVTGNSMVTWLTVGDVRGPLVP